MKYEYTEARTLESEPWGIAGVFPKHIVDSAPRDDQGYPRISAEHLIVGQGGGWDSSGTFDEAWLRRACELMNIYGGPT